MDKPEESEGQMQLGLRGAAVQEVKARGGDYLLIYDFDTLLAVHNGARLYRLD